MQELDSECIMTTSNPRGVFAQYGCGMSAPPSWVNFDSSPALYFERIPVVGRLYTKNETRFPKNIQYGDIVKGLPLTGGNCAGIYASHVLEHLALDDFRVALHNTFNLLMPSGIFRLIVPDLEIAVKRYMASESADAAEILLRETSLGRIARPKGLAGHCKALLGHANHLWMWDFKGLAHELAAVGFSDIRRCQPGDSEEGMFEAVENPERFVDSVAIQCRRPNS